MKNIIFICLFLVSSIACAETYEVVYQKGKVEVYRHNQLVPFPVLTGDTVKVYPKSMVVLKSPQETLKIFEDTEIKPIATKEGTLIDLVKGAIISSVVKKNFKIKTRTTTFGVRGTQFFVHSKGEDNWMCVNEGVVNVEKSKKSVDVPAGKGVFVDKNEISKPQAYAWTKKINWKTDPKQGELDHKVNMNYDVLENFYD